MKKSKGKTIWNNGNKRVILCVYGATGLAAQEHVAKVSIGKKVLSKTNKTPKTSEPTWLHYVFIESVPEELTFTIGNEEYTETEFHDIPEDQPTEKTYELSATKKKSQGNSGVLTVRYFITCRQDSRIPNALLPPLLEKGFYFHKPYESHFKSGDLIVFSGGSVVDIWIQLRTLSPYSRIGMVIELPNPHTENHELYLLECSRNYEEMIDAFRDDLQPGISLYRLTERIHNFYGNAIWWVPLKEEIDMKSENLLVKWVASLHRHADPLCAFDSVPKLRPEDEEFLAEFDGKTKAPANEFWGSLMIATLLEQSGMVKIGDDMKMGRKATLSRGALKKQLDVSRAIAEKNNLFPNEVVQLSCYSSPKLLFCLEQHKPDYAKKSASCYEHEMIKTGADHLRVSPNFALPFDFTPQKVAMEKKRQQRIATMVEEQGNDLAAIDSGESKSEEVITNSEDSEDPMAMLIQNDLQDFQKDDEFCMTGSVLHMPPEDCMPNTITNPFASNPGTPTVAVTNPFAACTSSFYPNMHSAGGHSPHQLSPRGPPTSSAPTSPFTTGPSSPFSSSPGYQVVNPFAHSSTGYTSTNPFLSSPPSPRNSYSPFSSLGGYSPQSPISSNSYSPQCYTPLTQSYTSPQSTHIPNAQYTSSVAHSLPPLSSYPMYHATQAVPLSLSAGNEPLHHSPRANMAHSAPSPFTPALHVHTTTSPAEVPSTPEERTVSRSRSKDRERRRSVNSGLTPRKESKSPRSSKTVRIDR
eukprot:TRINITY_DN3204_c0_g1_i4.p1 TRINITY_DN3204_c0_g1~~TRINITY_DN3204_c0_g1_i4.p1  ORF type:complete len:751 (+),score=116.87 TRINITY_DN3204_c0_g1_i4:95-2347(+)